MPTIIIAEKPDAAQHISEALSQKNLKKKSTELGVPWWEFERDGKKFITVAAVGHLFGLKQKKGVRDYPIFDVEWIPNFQANKKALFAKKYFELIEKFKGVGDEFIIACDFDNEGTVIGYNILKFIFGQEDAKRMKFSTLTKPDLIKSYQEIMPHLDSQNLECGYTRHIVDFYYGINISRGLMEAIKKAAPRFMILSAGRVQGPVLTMLSEREKQILAFKPTPFWQLQALLLLAGKETIAEHLTDKFWKKPEADSALKNSQAKNAIVESSEKKEHLENPPVPFNITSLQTEAYKLFGYSPQQTMQIAQSLYTAAFISYPRTSLGYNETIFIADASGKIKELKIGHFIDSLIESNKSVEKKAVSQELEVSNIHTFSVNLITNKIEIKPIRKIIRHQIDDELLEITTREGRKTVVTKSHSLFTFKDGRLVSIPTAELAEGDFIAIAKNIEFTSKQSSINLIERMVQQGMEKDFTITRIRGTPIFDLTYKIKNGNDYRYRNSIPLDVLIKYIDYKDILNLPIKIKARSGKNKFEIHPQLDITPEFARLLGYFDSEGCKWFLAGDKASYEINLTQENREVLEDMKTCIGKLFQINIIPKKYKCNANKLRLFGKTFYNIFSLLGCDGNCTTKKTSDLILSADNKIVAEYLKAYLAGDGHVHISGRGICYSTVSKNLANNLTFLLLRLGITSRIADVPPDNKPRRKETIFIVGIYGKENVHKFGNNIGFIKNLHLKSYKKIIDFHSLSSSTTFDMIDRSLIDWNQFIEGVSSIEKNFTGAHHSKNITSVQVNKILKYKENDYLLNLKRFFDSDVALSQIVSISKVKSKSPYVYDLSIEDNENFLGGFGSVIFHNSSEKLPPQIGYRETLEAIAKIGKYKKLVQKLLALAQLKPTEGKRDDPAHEAIHPTVQPPDLEKLKGPQKNIYDLVCRRFLALFGEPAVREGMKIIFNIGKEKYKVLGRRTIKPGWIEFYGPLAKFDETALPDLKIGEQVPVKKIEMLDKETQPPSRWSQASMIKEMEKRGLGTRSTRASILQTLYDRKYVADKSVRVTDLGMKVAGTLKEFVPDFVDEKMTKALEEDMEKILSGKSEQKKIVDAAKKHVIKICEELTENEAKIGKNLGSAIIATQEDANTLGPCPKCEGGNLKVLFSIFTKKHFAGCSNYTHCAVCGFTKKACKCKCGICQKEKGKCADEWKIKEWKPRCATGFPLPHQASFQRLDRICDKCKTPMIKVLRKGKRPFNMCLDNNCETKKDWGKGKDKKKGEAGGKKRFVKKQKIISI